MIYYCNYTRLKKHGKSLHISLEQEPEEFVTNTITILDSEDGEQFHTHIEANDLDHAYMVFKTQLVIQHKIIL